jgi:hypothetical protein
MNRLIDNKLNSDISGKSGFGNFSKRSGIAKIRAVTRKNTMSIKFKHYSFSEYLFNPVINSLSLGFTG